MSRSWKGGLAAGVAAIVLMGWVAVPSFGQKGGGRSKAIQVKAELVEICPERSCATDVGGWDIGLNDWTSEGVYSLLPDAIDYTPDALVQSEILTHNTVYTLDTTDTLVNGLVGTATRYVRMHFYFPPTAYNPTTDLPRLPACWSGADQNEAVNWSVFSSNSMAFPDMPVRVPQSGFSRLDFNVRDTLPSCSTQVFRFWLRWPNVIITRLDDLDGGKRRWEVTTNQSGEASLEGQGGKRGQTQYYGDFRMPFKLILTEP